MKAKFLGIVTAEMVIGLRFDPNKVVESYDAINGYTTRKKPITRLGLQALGKYLPSDIGKRVYSHGGIHQVESSDQVEKRTGRTWEMQKLLGEAEIIKARERYHGEKNIWGLTIYKPRTNSE